MLGCDKNADCVDRTIGYSCACKNGYNGEDATVGSCLFAGNLCYIIVCNLNSKISIVIFDYLT